MKTITRNYKVFPFSELSDEAKDKAIEILSSVNIGYEWWVHIYEDAENVGLKIDSFDLDRNRHASGILLKGTRFTIDAIFENHGTACETYKTALEYKTKLDALMPENYLCDCDCLCSEKTDAKNKNGHTEDCPYEHTADCEYEQEQKLEELEEEFLAAILEDYSSMLQNECDYLQSSEAIIETIEANEYAFLEDGTVFN
jgi:hypothetical protein